jgi:hypothetical protein
MKASPNKPTSDRNQLRQIWSKLTKGPVTAAEAKDLERTFAGPQDPNLGEELMFPAQDSDEGAPETPRSKRPPLAGGKMPASTSRRPLAR